MQNKLTDLNNHLFAQLERLNDESMSPEDMVKEINRAKAITGVASQIIANGTLVLKAHETAQEYFGDRKTSTIPKMLTGESDA